MVEYKRKTTPMTSVCAGGRIILALLLAGVLAFIPLTDGLRVTAWANEGVSASSDAAATATDTKTTPETSGATTPSTNPATTPVDPVTPPKDIKDVVNEAAVPWAEAFIHYMDGTYSKEELLSIDADFFDDKDVDLAKRIRDDQKAAADSTESGSETDTTPAEEGSTVDSSSDSSSSSSSSSADKQASTGAEVPKELAGTHVDPSTDKYFSKPDGLEADTGPFTFSPNPTTDEFVASIGEQARQTGQEKDLYASVMIAQAILESGSGSSLLSKAPHFNLFGIKGSYQGSSVNMKTAEDDGTGSYYEIVSAFRSYPSTQESLADYADLLTGTMGSFYAPVLKSHTNTFNDACDYLQGHYATSTTYSAKLKAIIDAYDLTTFDNKVEEVAPTAPEEPERMPALEPSMPSEVAFVAFQAEPQPEAPSPTNIRQLIMVALLVIMMGAAYALDSFRKQKRQQPSDA